MRKKQKEARAFGKRMAALGGRALEELSGEKQIAWLNVGIAQFAAALNAEEMENLRREVFSSRRYQWIRKVVEIVKLDNNVDLWLVLDAQVKRIKKSQHSGLPFDEITAELESMLPPEKEQGNGLQLRHIANLSWLAVLCSVYFIWIDPTSSLMMNAWRIFDFVLLALLVRLATQEREKNHG